MTETQSGEGQRPNCGTGWTGKDPDDPCDLKYAYAASAWYWLDLNGQAQHSADDLQRHHDLLHDLMRFFPVTDSSWMTERHAGIVLNGLVYLNQLGHDTTADIAHMVFHLGNRQAEKGSGWILHSLQRHEGIGEFGHAQCASPWMSNILHYALTRAAAINSDAQAVANALRAANGAVGEPRGTGDVVRYFVCPEDPQAQAWVDARFWGTDQHLPDMVSLTGDASLWGLLTDSDWRRDHPRLVNWQHYGVW
ncbi:MAG: hypothetical protein AAF358_13645 [Pseudomonadota bacterium]